jgi:hypothetical protein
VRQKRGVLYRTEGSWKDSCSGSKGKENKESVYRFVGIGKKAKGGVIRVLQTFKIYDPDQFGSNLAPLDKEKEKNIFFILQRNFRSFFSTCALYVASAFSRLAEILTT